MKIGRLAARGIALALVAGWAVPGTAGAVGGSAPSLSFSSPSGDGSTITTSPVVLSGTVTRPAGNVDSVEVVVEWIDKVPGRANIPHPDQREVVAPSLPTPSYTWSFPLAPAANGQYRVIVTATTDDAGTPQKQTQQNIASSTFYLDVPPATPANFTETTQKTKRTAALSWSANQEPDLIGYVLFRGGPNKNDPVQYLNGVYAPGTSYTDSTVASAPAGTYRYVILAVRPSAQGGSSLDYSKASGEADAVMASPPVAPSPTTVAPGSSGSSGVAPVGSSAAARAGAVGAAPILPGGDPLSAYQGLVSQADATTATTQPPDTGFNSKLPYQPKTSQQQITEPGAALGASDAGGGPIGGTQQTVEYVAAALILAVIALFGMLLKRAADQSPALEAAPPLPPDLDVEPAAGAELAPVVEEPDLAPVAITATPPRGWSARRRPAAEHDWGLGTLLTPVAPEPSVALVDRVEPVGSAESVAPEPAVESPELGFDDLDYEASLVGAPASRPLRSGWR